MRLPALTSARPRQAVAAAVLTMLFSALVGGCGAGGAPDRNPAPAAAGNPVTVQNCGRTVTAERPPERVVSIHQHATEVLLALGLQDRMVGTAYPDNPMVPAYRDAYEQIPQLSDEQPSFEDVIATEPNLVYGGYGSAFAESAGASRDAFAQAGIDTYLNLENCTDGPISMTAVYRELRTVGKIFDVPERAEALVAEMQSTVAQVRKKVKGAPPKRVFVYDSGEDAAFTAGGKGIGNEIIELAGGVNIFSDVADVFADVSWEQVVARQPEVIVIYDYYGSGSVADKQRFLQTKPELREVPAVANGRVFVLPLGAAVVGVRPADAVARLAPVLHPDRFRS